MKSLIIVLILLVFNTKAFAHYSLKQHSIIHYYPSLEKKYLYNKCVMGSLKRKNCNIQIKEEEKNSSQR